MSRPFEAKELIHVYAPEGFYRGCAKFHSYGADGELQFMDRLPLGTSPNDTLLGDKEYQAAIREAEEFEARRPISDYRVRDRMANTTAIKNDFHFYTNLFRRITMRKLNAVLFVLAALVAGVPAIAQTQGLTFPQSTINASQWGTWQIGLQQANTYLFSPGTYCAEPAPAKGTFFPFATNAPIAIIDRTPSLNEVVTPSNVTNTNAQCGITVAPANTHYSAYLTSATGGLQEALNTVAATQKYPVEIMLDRNWFSAVNAIGVASVTSGSVINSVVGSQATFLEDITTDPFTFYSWNGTKFVVAAYNITAPTVAAGAGAGTGPTISVVGNGTSGFVTLTTGTTPTASAAIFTLTWPSIANGGFSFAPNCLITSAGTRSYTSGVASSTAGPPATATETASATALTASVSGYVFQYQCH